MGNPLSYKYALPYIYSQYHIMREKCYIFLEHSQPLSEGGGDVPPRLPLKSSTVSQDGPLFILRGYMLYSLKINLGRVLSAGVLCTLQVAGGKPTSNHI